jgi:hypothetical protein
LANRGVHRRFVERLAQLLPASDRPPIVTTDAGFRTPWFQLLAERHWHWIGRVRNRDFVRNAEADWFAAKSLYARARRQAQDLGLYQSVRSNPLDARLVFMGAPAKGRKCRYRSGREMRNALTKKIATRHREPWLLSSSPALSHLSAQAIVGLYAQRMRIEQQFRDTKDCALGMGLRHARSTGVMRLQALLLIAHVAALAKRLIGEAAKAHNLQLQTPHRSASNATCTRRPDLSVATTARQVNEAFNLALRTT